MIVILIIFITGLIFMMLATSRPEYIGTLKECYVFDSSHQNTKCDNNPDCFKYYAMEVFYKDNTTETCNVKRLTAYNDRDKVEHFCNTRKLNTTRPIYDELNDPGRCFDNKIKHYKLVISYSLISIAFFIFFCLGIVWMCEDYYKTFMKKYMVVRDIELSNV